jgi:sn-glycerol 3-phosphate transport system substrate-binding protein
MLALVALVATTLIPLPSAAQQKVQVDFWHGLTRPLGDTLEQVAADFNASQTKYQVNATFKGSYPETMVAAIAAFRAGNAPHIVQMFEVGTATMMAARGAIKPVYQLMREAEVPFDPNIYVPAIKSYYSTSDGRMMSMPFNSSTAIAWYNWDAFKKAGLDPNRPPRTWRQTRAAAMKIREANAAPCGFTMAWPTWTQFEQFSAIHDIPLATRANGMDGMDAELRINSPVHVQHVQTLLDMQKEGSFKYGGRDAAGDAMFPSGECAIFHGSSALRPRAVRDAKFSWGVTFLPFYEEVPTAPKNSIIGGASFWVMTSPKRTAEEYKAVAEFFRYISTTDVQAKWHTDTGYLPITVAAYEKVKTSGFYQKFPDLEIPYKQLTLTTPSENSRGLRLGNMPEIRNIIQEEVEKALQGYQGAKEALDKAVQRGNTVLRNFERANR